MGEIKPIATLEGRSDLILERSCTPVPDDLGNHQWTMDLWWNTGDVVNGCGTIGWDIPSLEMGENIGVWVENGELTDYDGVMSLPRECITLLESVGIKVGPEYRDEVPL